MPVELRGPVLWSNRFDIGDFVNNVLLYAPLGLALWRQSLLVGLARAAILSTAIEILQIWHFERFGSAFDVLANVLGTACGILLARRLAQSGRGTPDLFSINQRLTAFAILGVVMLLALWVAPARPSNLSNWNPDFELLLG
ncbi:MAG: VanZ family protein, partial [Nitrospira sp.]